MSVTLLQKGKIVVAANATSYDKERISNMTAIEYIMEWFTARTPSSIGGTANIDPRGLLDRVLIIKAGTGSGKSTTIAPYLYANFVGKGLGAGRSIGVTQPRILTTISIPNKIAKIPSMSFLRFGDNLGYQTGMFINKPIKGVVFMTIGVIAQQLTIMTDEEFMRKYSFIILDECHERSLHLDLAMYKLKKFIMVNYKNTLCPFLILTSATFDTMKYAKYFDCGPENIIEVLGQSKPIADNFTTLSCSNMSTAVVKKIIEIHEDNTHDYNSKYGRDIIVFVSVKSKIGDILEAIENYNSKGPDNYLIGIKLTAETYRRQGANYKNIYRAYEHINISIVTDAKSKSTKTVHPARRVIVATPVAETGVTIDSLKYCIDTGLVMSPTWNPIYGATVIAEQPVTKNMAMQRKGRVGRSFPGEWHPLYTQKIFDSFRDNTLPDIVKNSSDEIVLPIIIEQTLPDWDRTTLVDLSDAGSFDLRKIDLMDPIPYDSLSNSLRKFYALGIITDEYKPTLKALCTMKFSHVEVESVCMILAGYVHGANIISLTTIAAFISVGADKLFGRKYQRRQIFDGDKTRSMFKTRLFIGCDFIDYIFIYDQVKAIVKDKGSISEWCDKNNINHSALKTVFTMRDGIASSLISIGLNPYRNVPGAVVGSEMAYSLTQHILADFNGGVAEVKSVKQCILDGYRMNTAVYNPIIKKYVNMVNGSYIDTQSDLVMPVGVGSADDAQSRPKKIVYSSQMLRKKPGSPYKFDTGAITVLDGFIDYDMDLLFS
jgi:HrpA-like RNA helicase